MILRIFLCFTSLATLAAPVCAQTPVAPPHENIDWPSPDGKFAFRISYEAPAIELIDRKSGNKLPLGGEEPDGKNWNVLWAPDSKRFALMSRFGHPLQTVDVYFQSGDTFRKMDLPELPNADIPDKLKRGKKFPHFANLNWQRAEKWKEDGSLAVTITTMIDGDGRSITATRTVELRFDPAGKARIAKSIIRYETAKD
jgi:hypothetical protein